MSYLDGFDLSEAEVPPKVYFGDQTQRAMQNFPISQEKMPIQMIKSLALVKKACAQVNFELGLLPEEKKYLIAEVSDEIIRGELDEHFPLMIWQSGSGTQTNMNINEVISNRAQEKSEINIHPNDDVNMSQSTNDVFPTAMHIAALIQIENSLLPALHDLFKGLSQKSEEFKDIIKVGRTHLMDAAPITLGQEFSGYARQIEQGIKALLNAKESLGEIALGATAVGTGLNTLPEYASKAALELYKLTGLKLVSAPNKFEAIAASDAILEMSSSIKRVACSFLKIVNDIRLMASGPNCGLSEILLPENEPGSSIMPGKVNPTQCEVVAMAMVQIMGNDTSITIAASMGNFELNVFRPLMIYNLLQSIRLLSDSAKNFLNKCLKGISPNKERIKELLSKSLMLATSLNPIIGYDKATLVVNTSKLENISLREAVVKLGFLTIQEFDKVVDPKKMV